MSRSSSDLGDSESGVCVTCGRKLDEPPGDANQPVPRVSWVDVEGKTVQGYGPPDAPAPADGLARAASGTAISFTLPSPTAAAKSEAEVMAQAATAMAVPASAHSPRVAPLLTPRAGVERTSPMARRSENPHRAAPSIPPTSTIAARQNTTSAASEGAIEGNYITGFLAGFCGAIIGVVLIFLFAKGTKTKQGAVFGFVQLLVASVIISVAKCQ